VFHPCLSTPSRFTPSQSMAIRGRPLMALVAPGVLPARSAGKGAYGFAVTVQGRGSAFQAEASSWPREGAPRATGVHACKKEKQILQEARETEVLTVRPRPAIRCVHYPLLSWTGSLGSKVAARLSSLNRSDCRT
jgi:hypothetical protein